MERPEFWVPLESNPEVLTKFVHKIGVPDDWVVSDVFGLDDELLDMLPKPVVAFILLMPLSTSRPDLSGDSVRPEDRPAVFFMTQNVYNSCGTVALIHAVANSPISVDEDSILGKLINAGQNLSATERGASLEKMEKLNEVHSESASEGQTTAPAATSNTYMHFVALVRRDGRLWELDGTRAGLLDHGPSAEETFLADAAAVCRRIVEANPDENRFSVLAVTANPESRAGETPAE